MENSSDKPGPSSENKDNHMHQWDGSESEFVDDVEAADYEEYHTGIRLSYTLQASEIYSCLFNCYPYKGKRKMFTFGISFLIFAAVMNFILYVFVRNTNFLLFGFLLVAIVVGNVGMYSSKLKKTLAGFSIGKNLEIEVYPDEIVVEENNQKWEIPLDGSFAFEEFENMILIYLDNGKIFVIPLRCIEPDLVADVQAMILAGTVPKKDD